MPPLRFWALSVVFALAAFAPTPVDPFALYEYAPSGAGGIVFAGYSTTTGRTPVSAALAEGETTGIFLVVGQSLLANHNGALHSPSSTKVQNLNPYDGTVYQMKNEVLGASGSGNGSILPYLGDKLITAGTFDRVIFVPVAIGGSAMRDWEPAGMLFHRLVVAILRAREKGYAISGVIFELGQSDQMLGTSQAAWQSSFQRMLDGARGYGFNGPWFVARCSMLSNVTSSTVRAAQAAVVDNVNVFAGPDIDTLTSSTNRSDGTHLTATGANGSAALWETVLSSHF